MFPFSSCFSSNFFSVALFFTFSLSFPLAFNSFFLHLVHFFFPLLLLFFLLFLYTFIACNSFFPVPKSSPPFSLSPSPFCHFLLFASSSSPSFCSSLLPILVFPFYPLPSIFFL